MVRNACLSGIYDAMGHDLTCIYDMAWRGLHDDSTRCTNIGRPVPAAAISSNMDLIIFNQMCRLYKLYRV